MTKAEALAAALNEFLDVSWEVEAAAVVSPDGLPMASALPPEVEEERLAAMSASLLALGERAAHNLDKGELAQVLVEGDSGYVLLMSAGANALLVAVTSHDAKVGLVLFEMKKAAQSVAAVMDGTSRPSAADTEGAPQPDAAASEPSGWPEPMTREPAAGSSAEPEWSEAAPAAPAEWAPSPPEPPTETVEAQPQGWSGTPAEAEAASGWHVPDEVSPAEPERGDSAAGWRHWRSPSTSTPAGPESPGDEGQEPGEEPSQPAQSPSSTWS